MQSALENRWLVRIMLSGVVLAGLTMPAASQSPPLRIGLLAPIEGPSAILGEQSASGARAAAEARNVELVTVNDPCTAEGGESAAKRFVQDKVVATVGFLCTESLEAALPILKDAGIPAITIGVRTDSITDRRDRTVWPVYRIAPRGDAEAAAAATIIPTLWRDLPFAIVDDGTISNRDLAEQLRAAAEEAGVKPVLVDAFRPALDDQSALVTKLSDVGAKAVFVSGDANDITIIADAAARRGIVVAGGENLASAADLPAGTLMIGLPVWRDIAAPAALAELDAKGVLPDGYVLPAFAAVQIVAAATQVETAAAHGMFVRIGLVDMQTAIGPVSFDAKGDLAHSPYRAFRFDGRRFTPLDTE